MPYISKRKICFNPNKNEANTKEIKKHNKWTIFYQDSRWKKLRHWQITNFPLCKDCMLNGISRAADEVHHVRPFSEGETMEEKFALLLDPKNLVSLCSECHRKRHNMLNN